MMKIIIVPVYFYAKSLSHLKDKLQNGSWNTSSIRFHKGNKDKNDKDTENKKLKPKRY